MTVLWVSQRTDSVVSEVGTDGGSVIVKQHRPEADAARPAAVRARHEYEVLTMLRGAMGDAYSVPRALELDEAAGKLVIERAPGTPLDVLIRDGKRRRDAKTILADPMRRAGRWLREMQQATREESDARELVRAQVEPALAQAYSPRIAARLRELAARVNAGATCGHHGDYWPGNVFIDQSRVQVIDFEGYRRGLPLEDVAYFLMQLELLLPRHRRHLPALREAFLEGYGGIGDEDALRLFTLTKTLLVITRNAHANHPFLLRLWMRRTLRNIVSRCLR